MKSHRFFLSILVGIAVIVCLLSMGWRTLSIKTIDFSVDLKSPAPFCLQVFWTESDKEFFTEYRSRSLTVRPGGESIRIRIPATNIRGLRVDFGAGHSPVRASPLRIEGNEREILDWRDFSLRHDIARFAIDQAGAVNIVPDGDDPYVVAAPKIAVRGRGRVNVLSLLFVALLSVAIWWWLVGPRGVLWNSSFSEKRGSFLACLAIAAILVCFRLSLTSKMSPAFMASPWDDVWFVNVASSLTRVGWLGAYGPYTLIKGIFGPAVLAVTSMIGMPFGLSFVLLYVLSCIFWVRILSLAMPNRVFLLLSFALLLFNPLSLSLDCCQRIYRNGMPLWQVPLVFGGFFLMYRSCRHPTRSRVKWAVFSGLALWMFQNTREDGIWLWPFALVCMALSSYRAWTADGTKFRRAIRMASCFLPLLIVLCGNAAICLVNWRVYGVPIRNDRDSGNYAKAMRDLYLIAPDPEDEARLSAPEHASHFHNIYYSTLCKAYAASPTLQGTRQEIDRAIDAWAGNDRLSERDLWLDHMLFAIRVGVADAGRYESLVESESFFGSVHRELLAAFRDGRLTRRGFSVTAMAAPFQFRNLPKIWKEWGGAIRFVGGFKGTEAVPICTGVPSPFPVAHPSLIPMFEDLSRQRMFDADKLDEVQACVDRTLFVGRLYSAFMPYVLALSLLSFGGVIILFVIGRKRFRGESDWLLLAAGVLASFLVQTVCIAYISATTFPATAGQYLAASFQMSLMFVTLVAGVGCRLFIGFFSKGRKMENENRTLSHHLE